MGTSCDATETADAAGNAIIVKAPGEHGGDGRAVALELGLPDGQILDLSASLNPFASDITALVRDLAGQAALDTYPDPAEALEALATHLGVDPDRLVLTNGGSEAIALVGADCGDGLVVDPDFSLYRRHLRTGEDASAGRWRSNPSSPLGVLAGDDDSAAVWDEAFWPMTVGTWTRGDQGCWRLGSLTKLWACPGVRIGYAIAPDSASADRIRVAQPRWAVNGLALALIPALLAETDLTSTAQRVAVHREAFEAAVSALGFSVRAGIAPWLLLDSTPGLRSALAPTGVIVRDCSSFGLDGVHRIALPRPEHVDRVVGALSSLAPSGSRSGAG